MLIVYFFMTLKQRKRYCHCLRHVSVHGLFITIYGFTKFSPFKFLLWRATTQIGSPIQLLNVIWAGYITPKLIPDLRLDVHPFKNIVGYQCYFLYLV